MFAWRIILVLFTISVLIIACGTDKPNEAVSVPFSVIKVYPSASDGPVPIDTRIEVHFSKSIDTSSFNGFALEFDTDIPGTFVFADSIVYYQLDSLLSITSSYSATLASWVKDIDGNSLGEEYSWTFATDNGAGFIWNSSIGTIAEYAWDVCWGNNQFITAGVLDGDLYPNVYSSPDGISWTMRNDSITAYMDFIDYWNAKYIAGCELGILMNSINGADWNYVDTINGALGDRILGSAANDTMLVAVGYFAEFSYVGEVAVSTDGSNWTETNYNGKPLTDICWTGDKFIATVTNNAVHNSVCVSSDALNWSEVTLPDTLENVSSLDAITCSDDLIIAVGTYGAVYTSPDGVIWTKQDTHTDGLHYVYFNDVIWNGHIFVIVGGYDNAVGSQGGIIMTSPDGIDWTPRVVMPGDNIRCNFTGIAWSGDRFVVTSAHMDGLVYHSP